MTYTLITRLSALFLILAAPLLGAETPSAPPFSGKSVEFPPSYHYPMKPGEGDQVIQKCSMCHSLGYILNQGPQTRVFWEHETHKMVEAYKAPISPEEEKAIVDYLSKFYGKP